MQNEHSPLTVAVYSKSIRYFFCVLLYIVYFVTHEPIHVVGCLNCACHQYRAEVRCPSLTSSNFIAIQNHTNSQTNKCARAHMQLSHCEHALDVIKSIPNARFCVCVNCARLQPTSNQTNQRPSE